MLCTLEKYFSSEEEEKKRTVKSGFRLYLFWKQKHSHLFLILIIRFKIASTLMQFNCITSTTAERRGERGWIKLKAMLRANFMVNWLEFTMNACRSNSYENEWIKIAICHLKGLWSIQLKDSQRGNRGLRWMTPVMNFSPLAACH